MTRKDFQLVADVVAASTVTANLTDTQREDLAYEFARALKGTNERFQPGRFFAACGVETEVGLKMVEQFVDGSPYIAR